MRVKFHTGKKRILENKNVFDRKDMGIKNFWEHIFGSKEFLRETIGSKIWEAIFLGQSIHDFHTENYKGE